MNRPQGDLCNKADLFPQLENPLPEGELLFPENFNLTEISNELIIQKETTTVQNKALEQLIPNDITDENELLEHIQIGILDGEGHPNIFDDESLSHPITDDTFEHFIMSSAVLQYHYRYTNKFVTTPAIPSITTLQNTTTDRQTSSLKHMTEDADLKTETEIQSKQTTRRERTRKEDKDAKPTASPSQRKRTRKEDKDAKPTASSSRRERTYTKGEDEKRTSSIRKRVSEAQRRIKEAQTPETKDKQLLKKRPSEGNAKETRPIKRRKITPLPSAVEEAPRQTTKSTTTKITPRSSATDSLPPGTAKLIKLMEKQNLTPQSFKGYLVAKTVRKILGGQEITSKADKKLCAFFTLKKGSFLRPVAIKGEAIRSRFEELGLSETQTAKKAGIPQANLNKMVHEEINVSQLMARKLAPVLQCSPHDLAYFAPGDDATPIVD